MEGKGQSGRKGFYFFFLSIIFSVLSLLFSSVVVLCCVLQHIQKHNRCRVGLGFFVIKRKEKGGLEMKDEVQEMARIKEEATKLRESRRYNTKVKPWAFQPGDLVWRVQGEARKDPRTGKLGTNWEGSFRVVASLDNEA